MAFNAFLKLGDIAGSSFDESHPGWIVVESYGLGLDRAVGSGGGGIATTGRAQFSEFTFVARDARAAVPILDSSVKGLRHEVELHLTSPDMKTGGTRTYASYKLTDCLITSVRDAGSLSETLPAQAVSLVYQKAELTYVPSGDKAVFDNTGGAK